MEVGGTILEYLKALTTFPAITLVLVVLGYFKFQNEIRAILKNLYLKSPSGWVVAAQQEERAEDRHGSADIVNAFVAVLHGKDREMLARDQQALQAIQDLRVKNVVWEFRYLGLYLVHKTQVVLFEWFYRSGQPMHREFFNDLWRGKPEYGDERERDAVISALVSNELLKDDGAAYEITAKGSYFLQFMGYIQQGGKPKDPAPTNP